MRRVIALGMSFALVTGGCSFALVSGPPTNHRELPAFECTTSRVGPILDTVWTALQALNAGLAIASSDADWDEVYSGDPPFSRNVGIGVHAAFAALGAAGMWFGYTRTASCRSAKKELAVRALQNPPSTGSMPWPPPPPAGTGAPAPTPNTEPAPPAPGPAPTLPPPPVP